MWACGKKKKPHSDIQESETLKSLRQKEAEVLRLQEQNQILLQQKISEGFSLEIEELKKFRTELTDFARQLQLTLASIRDDTTSSPSKQNMLLRDKEEELRIKLKQLEILERESKLREESIKLLEQEKRLKAKEDSNGLGQNLNQSEEKDALENDQNLKTQGINDDLFDNPGSDLDADDDAAGTPTNKENADGGQNIIQNNLNSQDGALLNEPKEDEEQNINPFEV